MDMNPNQIADQILAALNGHNYLLAAALLLVVAVYIARWAAARVKGNKYAAWLNTDRGGAVLSLILSTAGGLVTALKAGAPINLALFMKVLVVATSGAGTFNLYKRIMKPSDRPASPPAVPPAAAILLIPLVFVFACAHVKATLIDFGKCELGQIPGALSGVLTDVNKTLGGESPNWQGDMEALGKKEGMEAVNCAVAAVLHNLAAKKGALDDIGKRKSERGQIWLAGHRVAQ